MIVHRWRLLWRSAATQAPWCSKLQSSYLLQVLLQTQPNAVDILSEGKNQQLLLTCAEAEQMSVSDRRLEHPGL